jgi:hypothetical protein
VTFSTSTSGRCATPRCSSAADALGKPDYIALWNTLKPDSQVEEVVRNFFIRQPTLWLD